MNTIYIVQLLFGIELDIELDQNFNKHIFEVISTELNKMLDLRGDKELVIKELLDRLRTHVQYYKKLEGSDS